MQQCVTRLQKEAQSLESDPPELIRARSNASNILKLHYCVRGPPDTPYAGGYYHGALVFPPEYPLRPPSVYMYTPSGRFEIGTRLCLSLSDYHPESWKPSWSSRTILLGLQSFMAENEMTAGSITTTDDEKRLLARRSLAYNMQNREFCELFPEYVDEYRKQQEARASGGSAPLPQSPALKPTTPATTPLLAATGSASTVAAPGPSVRDATLPQLPPPAASGTAGTAVEDPAASSGLRQRGVGTVAAPAAPAPTVAAPANVEARPQVQQQNQRPAVAQARAAVAAAVDDAAAAAATGSTCLDYLDRLLGFASSCVAFLIVLLLLRRMGITDDSIGPNAHGDLD